MQQGELVAAVVEEGDKKAGARGTRSAYESTQQKEEEEITRRSSNEKSNRHKGLKWLDQNSKRDLIQGRRSIRGQGNEKLRQGVTLNLGHKVRLILSR